MGKDKYNIKKLDEVKRKVMARKYRNGRKAYVYVYHHPTHRVFALNRSYSLIEGRTDADFKQKETVTNEWTAWFPTMDEQSPEWAKEYPHEEFTAYWVES